MIVIAGPNGSGKTTVTEQILRHEWMEDAIYINPDIVAQELFGDWNSAEAVKKSIAYCEALREKSLAEGKSLIDAVHEANIAGAISVTRMGAQPAAPTREEIIAMKKKK